MKKQEIILEKPFSLLYNKGYIFIRPDNRKYIQLYNSNTNNKMLSYARYLMGVKLGYEVPSEFEVDHIDNNPFNDSIENLQLLSKVENIKKYEYNKKISEGNKNFFCNSNCRIHFKQRNNKSVSCACCNKELEQNEIEYKIINNKTKEEKYYCSRKCFYNTVNMHTV